MDDLIFIAEKHMYITADEKVLPSVSDLTRPLSSLVYGDIDPEVLAIAAMKGTAVHELTVKLDTEKIVDAPAEISGYIEAYAHFLAEHKASWYKWYTEQPMRYEDLYAGTIDRFGIVDDKRTLVDIKTSSRITNKHLVVYEAQLNLYRRMLEAHEEKVEQLYILHLKKDGGYRIEVIPIDDTLADECLYINKRMNERKRRSKK